MRTYAIGDIVYQDEMVTVTVNNFHRLPLRITMLILHIWDKHTDMIYEEHVSVEVLTPWLRVSFNDPKYPAAYTRLPFAAHIQSFAVSIDTPK